MKTATALLLIATVLTGCDPGGLSNETGAVDEADVLVMNPLCLFVCIPTVAATGGDEATGGGTTSGSKSTTLTTSPTGGAKTGG